MYVTLYNRDVHRGVKMVLGLGRLDGSSDRNDIDAAGRALQDWEAEANRNIKQLIDEVRPFSP